MNIDNFKYFKDLCETKSFTETAKNMFTTQSNVSKKIKELEEELKVTLLERRRFGKEVLTTKDGEKVFKFSKTLDRRILKLKKELIEVEEFRDIKLGFPPLLGKKTFKKYIIPIMKLVMENNHEIEIFEERVSELRKNIVEEKIDFAITKYLHTIPKNAQVNILKLYEMGIKIYGNIEYMKALDKKNPIKDLNDVTVISLKSGTVYNNLAKNVIEKFKLKPKKVIKVENFAILQQMISDGIGISILGDGVEFRNKKIASISVNLDIKILVCLEYNKYKELSEMDQKIINLINNLKGEDNSEKY